MLLALLLALVGSPAPAAEFVPVAQVDLLGGQFFLEDQHTSFSGNANWLFTPGVKLSDTDLLVPSFSGQYRRTREVRELLGGGFLTQESLDNAAALTWVHLSGDHLALKPSVSFKNELITESEDEKLGDGLFDYHKVSAGMELEHRYERLLLRHGPNLYTVRFYHYEALNTDIEGVEINAGDNVLDFNAIDYSGSAQWLATPGLLVSGSTLFSYRPFRSQQLVTDEGTYSAQKRRDLFSLVSLGAQQKLPEAQVFGGLQTLMGVSSGLSFLRSNQHSYDASQVTFLEDFYDYDEYSAAPYVAFQAAQKLRWTLSYDYTRRQYKKRPIQFTDATYGSIPIRQDTHTISADVSYPLGAGLALKIQGSWRKSFSNMKYEANYRYNYSSAHYFAGLGWQL